MPSVVQLAREAAAAARAGGWAEREALVPPATRFRGVHVRGTKYAAVLWNPPLKKRVWLGSYATAVEAAYAYDAAARSVLGVWARPNFPALSPAPAADVARARRAPEPARQQQHPAPRYKALRIRCWAPTPASSELSTAAESSSAATAPYRCELPHMPAMAVEPDQSVVGDNFTDSAAA